MWDECMWDDTRGMNPAAGRQNRLKPVGDGFRETRFNGFRLAAADFNPPMRGRMIDNFDN